MKFKRGEIVVRRPFTLGNMDGSQPSGVVEDIFDRGGHTMVTVKFPTRRETFVADTYVSMKDAAAVIEWMANRPTAP